MANEQTPDPTVVFDPTRVGEITDTTLIDEHQPIRHQLSEFGEDWGDGFFVEDELVVVDRDIATGGIVRTTPISEVVGLLERDEDAEVVEAEAVTSPTPLPTSDREKLARILANRLFNWYKAQPPSPTMYNPVYDGIPKEGISHTKDAFNLKDDRSVPLHLATPYEVYEWIVRVVGQRVNIINQQQGHRGHRRDAAENYALRLSRDPVTR